MSDEPRVRQLLDEILDSDRTPEEICADCPDLLTQVRQRWEKVRRMEAQLDVLLPGPTPDRGADTLPPGILRRSLHYHSLPAGGADTDVDEGIAARHAAAVGCRLTGSPFRRGNIRSGRANRPGHGSSRVGPPAPSGAGA